MGDQKFISLNSDGFAFSTFCGCDFGCGCGGDDVDGSGGSVRSNCSSVSSLMCVTELLDDVACEPNRLDRNQPRPAFSIVEAAFDGLMLAMANVPVKNGFGL